ncbi:MAG: hypothetical protein AAB909_00535 [Patescibacteria group bacterium]
MNTVRRSTSFPTEVYEALRLEAFSRRMSVNQLVIEKLKPATKKGSYDALFQMRGAIKGKPDMSVTIDEIYDDKND